MTRIVGAAEFEAKCRHMIEEIATTGEPVVITRNDHPIAQLLPVSSNKPRSLFGAMAGRIDIIGDIEAPIDTDWEAQR